MLFNSIQFIIFFICIIIAVYALKKKFYQHFFLLIASFYFYWVSSESLILLLFLVILITYYSGHEIHRAESAKRKKLYISISVITCLGILGFFKYFNFAVNSVANLFNAIGFGPSYYFFEIVLPIGISFYTFQALTYVFDIYRGELEPTDKLYKYALFVSFFPQLVAGPIVRAKEFLPQLKNQIHISYDNVKLGTTLIGWGFVKKVIIADNVAYYANHVFSNPFAPIENSNSFFIIAATILFGIQIYCDFSGYCDIAIGCATILGFWLPQNFNHPYFSSNPSLFWRRWHITLSRFIRDYLYIPLGGNRKGQFRTYFNLLFTMLACGLWHGASWNFVCWGGFHGVLLIGHKMINGKLSSLDFYSTLKNSRLYLIISILVTQYFVFMGWIMFRVRDFNDMIIALEKFIFIDFSSIAGGLTKYTDIIYTNALLLLIALLLVIVLFGRRLKAKINLNKPINLDFISYIAKSKDIYWGIYLFAVILAILCLAPSASPEFIYFQF